MLGHELGNGIERVRLALGRMGQVRDVVALDAADFRWDVHARVELLDRPR